MFSFPCSFSLFQNVKFEIWETTPSRLLISLFDSVSIPERAQNRTYLEQLDYLLNRKRVKSAPNENLALSFAVSAPFRSDA